MSCGEECMNRCLGVISIAKFQLAFLIFSYTLTLCRLTLSTHTHTHTHTHTPAHIDTYIHTYLHTNIHTYIHTYIYVHALTRSPSPARSFFHDHFIIFILSHSNSFPLFSSHSHIQVMSDRVLQLVLLRGRTLQQSKVSSYCIIFTEK
jgi:hypothetical protein